MSRSEQHGPARSIWISILAIQRGKLAGCTVDRTLSCLQHSSMSNTDDDIKGMEHNMQTVYIRMGTSHQPSCSLVSCLSLNLPALKPSAHGLDITTNSSHTSPLLAIDLSSFETLTKTSLLPSKHQNESNRTARARRRTHEPEPP